MHFGSHSSVLFTKGTHAMSNTKDKKPAAANKKKLFVEKQPEGDSAVRKGNSERANELNPVALPVVESVRDTTAENPDQWRKA